MLKYINESTNTQEEYGYACARIRELEKYLLNNEVISKMIESFDLEGSIKVLVENDFSDYSLESYNNYSLDQILNEVSKKTINIISEISPYTYLPQLFRWKYDFANIKVLLKVSALGSKDPYPLYDFGNIGINNLKSAVFEEKYQLVPVKIERIIKSAVNEYMKSSDFQLMEIILDRGYYEIVFDILKEINHPFLFYFYKSKIDLLNFNILCRCKIRSIKKSKLSDFLIDPGHFSIHKFINIYSNSIHSWPNNFQKTEYSQIFEEGIKHWLEDNSLLKLEQLSDNYLLSLLNIGKYTTFGLESIIGYYYAKENDIKNIRIILNSKRHNFPNEIIKKNVRDTYV